MTPNNSMPPLSDDQVRKEVDSFYQQVTDGTMFKTSGEDHIYASLGYDLTLLNDLPEEIRSGLSCGNPLEHLFLEKAETLLDLGCGMGLDCLMTRLKFPESGMIYGVDRLPAMILRAERARDRKGLAGIEFRQGSLIELPFADASMDKIISNCVINLEPDKQTVYGEIHRVLKPGGMFFISDITLKKPLSEELRRQENLFGG